MRRFQLLGILIILTTSINAIAAGSATTPFTGLFNYSEMGVCTADSALALPSGYPTSFNRSQIGQHSMVPDTTRTFNNWVNYAMGLKPGMTNPNSLLTTSLDPSSITVPQASLKETPIQWFTNGTGVNAPIDSEIAYTTPYTSVFSFNISSSSNQFGFVTSFSYSTPANLGGKTTGYAIYVFSGGGWRRHLTYITTAANVPATNAVLETIYDKTYTVGSTPYAYHCVNTQHLTK